MQADAPSGFETLFHPPGCDPFHVTASPKSHYFPSDTQHQSTELQKTILTPEKRKKFDIKSNDSYSPLSYSFFRNELIEVLPEKLLIESSESDSCAASELPDHFVELWPSSGSTSKSSRPESYEAYTQGDTSPEEEKESVQESIIILSDEEELELPSATPKMGRSQQQQERLECSFLDETEPKLTSTQKSAVSSSNISELVNRFHYGKPPPPSGRKHPIPRSANQSEISSCISDKPPLSERKKYSWHSTSVNSSKKSTFSSTKTSDLPESSSARRTSSSQENNIDELQEKVEQMLKDSTSALSTQPSTGLSSSSLVSTQQEASSKFLTESMLNVPQSSSTESKTKYVEDISPFPTPAQKQSIPSPSQDIDSSRTKDDTSPLSEPTLAKPNILPSTQPSGHFIAPPLHSAPRSPCKSSFLNQIPIKDDILARWRLRRKMEAAREAVNNASPMTQAMPEGSDGTGGVKFVDGLRFAPAERPFDAFHHENRPNIPVTVAPRKSTRSIGVSVVPTTCAETQTSPPASLICDEIHLPQKHEFVSSKNSKDADVSIQRVKVVQSTEVDPKHMPTSPASDSSQHTSTDTWAEIRTSAKSPDSVSQSSAATSNRVKSRVKMLQVTPTEPTSPTTAVVKQIVGARLFNSTTSEHIDTPERLRIADRADENISTGSSFNRDTSEEQFFQGSASTVHAGQVSPIVERHVSTVEDPESVLHKIIEAIEGENDEFVQDFVLLSLRERRRNLLQQLKAIEDHLAELGSEA